MLELILSVKPRQFARLIFSKKLERLAKVVIGLIVLAIFFSSIYLIFYRVFSYLSTVQDIGVLMIDRLIGIGFMAFLLMLVISNLISGISTLYRSPEAVFLMSTPLAHREIFWVKFIDNIFFSSWATLLLTIPVLIAYGQVFDFGWGKYFIISFLIIPPFLIIPAVLGASLSMIFFPISRKFGARKVLIFLLIIGVVAVFFMMRARFNRILFSMQGDLALLNYYLQDLATGDNIWSPSTWVAEALKSARKLAISEMWFYISMLLSTACMSIVVLDAIAERLYYRAFLSASEISEKKRKKEKARKSFYGSAWKIFAPFPRDMRSLFVKDIRLFVRDPSQWSQFIILLVLVIFYLINLRHFPLDLEGLYWRTLISFVNFAFCGYILATLSVRFVYPSMSMEGKSFWSISSSPISVKRLFWEKFWISFLIFFVLTEIVAVVSNALLAQSLGMTLLTGGGILAMSVSLTSLATGLGSIFPNFDELNPGKIASSGGGMICALASLVYVALSTIALALPTYQYLSYLIGMRKSFPLVEMLIGGVALIILNLVATFVPLKLGLRAIQRAEF